MTRYSLLVIISLFFSILSYGKTITFLNPEKTPIANVNCVGYTAGNDSISSWVSNAKGIINIQSKDIDHIVASHNGYSDKLIFNHQLGAENNIITMSPSVELDEVVVTPEDVKEFGTHILQDK